MKKQLDARLRSYVLGELDEERRVELEERLIMEPDLFELLGPEEDELVEDYLEDVLTPQEKAAFEQQFLTNDDRRWQVGFVRLMKEHASSMTADATKRGHVSLADPIAAQVVVRPPTNAVAGGIGSIQPRSEPKIESWRRLVHRPGFSWHREMRLAAMAASLLALVAGSSWFVVRERSVGQELGQLRAKHELEQGERRLLQTQVERLSAQAQALQTQLEAERRQRGPTEMGGLPEHVHDTRPPARPSSPLFALATGLLRSGGRMTRIAIPADAPVIRLRLELRGTDYPLYRVVLYDAQAEELWAQSQLTAQADDRGAAVTVILPSKLLPRGDYELVLSGVDRGQQLERVGAYIVRVTAP